MKGIRRLGLILVILVVGTILGNFGFETAVILLVPLFVFWLMLFDEKKYRQKKRQQNYEMNYYNRYS